METTGFSCWFIITCRYDSISKRGLFQTLPVALNPSGPLCVLGQLPTLPGATAEQLHLLVATLFCSFGFLREQAWKEVQNFCSVLLLVKKENPSWHLPCCLINTSRLVSFLASLFVLALTECASVDSHHVTNSSLATSHLSPFYQYAQRCPSAGKLNNVNKRGSATFTALFCSGLGMWRYQMGSKIWLYSSLLLSMLHFT